MIARGLQIPGVPAAAGAASVSLRSRMRILVPLSSLNTYQFPSPFSSVSNLATILAEGSLYAS